MAIILTKKSKSYTLTKANYALENHLQEYVSNNPDTIPVYDIDETLKLIILKREFQTNSGPVDILATDNKGNLYIVETKLFKNPDKRKVIAQALDYGASIYTSLRSFDDFTAQFDFDIRQKMQATFDFADSELDQVMNSLRENVRSGNFKFVILMDTVEDRLKDLIYYINRKSEFDIYAVELENYEHEDMQIVIPRLIGANAVKDSLNKVTTNRLPTDEELLASYEKSEHFPYVQEFLRLWNELFRSAHPHIRSDKTPKYYYISVDNDAGDSQIYINLHISPLQEQQMIKFWCFKGAESKAIPLLQAIPSIQITKKTVASETTHEVIAKLPISKFESKPMREFIEAMALSSKSL